MLAHFKSLMVPATALSVLVAVPLPYAAASAENWVRVAEADGGAGCYDSESVRREGTKLVYREKWCSNSSEGSRPKLIRVDCLAVLTGPYDIEEYVDGRWELGWEGDPDSVSGVVATELCDRP